MLLTKFQANRSFGLSEEAKYRFTNGGHLGFLIGMILTVFDLQVTAMPIGLMIQEKKPKIVFKLAVRAANLDFLLE